MFKFLTGLPAFAGLGIPPLPHLRDSTDGQIESHWLRIKVLLLQTFVYTHENRYRLLAAQAAATLEAILDRHRRTFEYSADGLRRHARIVSTRGDRPGTGLSIWNFEFDEKSREDIATEDLLAMCFLSYRSPRVVFPGWDYPLMSNPSGYCRTVEYLVNHRKSTRALFLKGLFCKYGIEPMNDVPDLATARASLVLADKQGDPMAKQELAHLVWHQHIERDTGRKATLWPLHSGWTS
jgi:hypothetical protein